MADWEWTKKETNKALAAISTLKRATGVQNHPTKKDEFAEIPRNQLRIYSLDQESAELIGELLYRYGNGKRAAFYDAHPERSTIRDSIEVKPLRGGGYVTLMQIYHPRHFSEKLSKMTEKFVAPDKHFTR